MASPARALLWALTAAKVPRPSLTGRLPAIAEAVMNLWAQECGVMSFEMSADRWREYGMATRGEFTKTALERIAATIQEELRKVLRNEEKMDGRVIIVEAYFEEQAVTHPATGRLRFYWSPHDAFCRCVYCLLKRKVHALSLEEH